MTPLDTQSITPLYQQVAQQLEQAVSSGELRCGDKIMSEAEMSRHYGVSRVTVSRVLREFARRGFLETGYRSMRILDRGALIDFASQRED